LLVDHWWTEQLTAADGTLYFTADDGVHGHELWALLLPR